MPHTLHIINEEVVYKIDTYQLYMSDRMQDSNDDVFWWKVLMVCFDNKNHLYWLTFPKYDRSRVFAYGQCVLI